MQTIHSQRDHGPRISGALTKNSRNSSILAGFPSCKPGLYGLSIRHDSSFKKEREISANSLAPRDDSATIHINARVSSTV